MLLYHNALLYHCPRSSQPYSDAAVSDSRFAGLDSCPAGSASRTAGSDSGWEGTRIKFLHKNIPHTNMLNSAKQEIILHIYSTEV